MGGESLAIVLAALFGLVGSAYATISSRRATRRTHEIERQHSSIAGYQALVADLHETQKLQKEEIKGLKARITELERSQRDDFRYRDLLIVTLRDNGIPIP